MMGSSMGFGFPGVGMFLVWGLIILFVVWLVRSLSRTTDARKSARQILDERFARGEIDRDEYERGKVSLE